MNEFPTKKDYLRCDMKKNILLYLGFYVAPIIALWIAFGLAYGFKESATFVLMMIVFVAVFGGLWTWKSPFM